MEQHDNPKLENTSNAKGEESAFYIEDEEKTSPKELLKDPTDFTDTVAAEKSRKRTRNLAIALGVFTAAILVIGLIIVNFTNNENDVPTPQPTPTKTTTSAPNKTNPATVINPLLDGFKAAPKVTAGEVIAEVKDNTITAGKNTLTFAAADKISPPSAPCKVTQPTDFCLAAQGKNDKAPFDIYYLKDAAHSRLFENPATFKKLTVANTPITGILPLQMGEDKLPTAVLVNEDSSGWMVVTQGADPAALETFVATLKTN